MCTRYIVFDKTFVIVQSRPPATSLHPGLNMAFDWWFQRLKPHTDRQRYRDEKVCLSVMLTFAVSLRAVGDDWKLSRVLPVLLPGNPNLANVAQVMLKTRSLWPSRIAVLANYCSHF